MFRRYCIVAIVTLLAACAGTPLPPDRSRAPVQTVPSGRPTPPVPVLYSSATNLEDYRLELARHMTRLHADQISVGRPQNMLRAVIVVKFSVTPDGALRQAEILRSNHDPEAERLALNCLRSSAPFPRPRNVLLRNDGVDLYETWLFNDDGRYQLRSLALPQSSE